MRQLERTADGFRLRARCGEFADTVLKVGLAGVVSSLPFVLWWDLIRGLWSDEGFSFWITCAFLAVWATAILYTIGQAMVSLAGELRVSKAGGRGEIFTGIGKLGWTHRFAWSEFQGVRVVEKRTAGRASGVVRYLALEGPSRIIRLGRFLSGVRQADVAVAMRELGLGDEKRPVRQPALQAWRLAPQSCYWVQDLRW